MPLKSGPVALVVTLLAMVSAGYPQDPSPQGRRGQGRQGGPERPLRDAARAEAPVAGTATVSGTIVVTGMGAPARRARMMLAAAQGGGSRTTLTDDNGRFVFQAVAAGRYNLSALKAGHVGISYGQTRPGRPGTPILLGEGEKFTANLQLPRGSVITGTVLDEHGEPNPGTQVRVMRYVMQGGRRTLQQSGSGVTDDRGIYRVYGLQPGDYVVSAVPRNTGRPPDIGRLREELAAVRERLTAARGDEDVARDLAIRASMLQADIPEADAQTTGYAPVYYPGTMSAAEAAPVPVGVGEERTNVDFQLQRVPMARIDGIVVNATGQTTQNVQLTLTQAGQSAPGAGPITARADPEGRFRLINVPPGNYRLVARAAVISAGPPAPETPGGRGGRGRTLPAVRLWGSADIPVDGRAITNLVVTLQQGMTISGRIAFDGSSRQPPSDLSRLRVTLIPADSSAGGAPLQPAAGTVDTSGRFTIPGVVPGSYRLSAAGAGNGWLLDTANVDGQDTLDFPFDVRPGSNPVNAVITFTDRQAQLTGSILNQRNEPAPGYTLILFAADERFWGPQSRRIRSTRPDTDGQFTFSGFPAGDYKLVALEDVEPGAWFEPEFLQHMEGAAISLRIGEGEKKVQNVQIASGGA